MDNKSNPTKNKAVKKVLSVITEHENKVFRYAFFIVAALIFVIRPMFSGQFGPSSDEPYHKAIGDSAYNYLATGGKDKTILHLKGNDREDTTLLQNYGPLLEVVSAAVYKNLHTNPYPTRHLILCLFTFLLFFYCGLTAYKIGGWRAGLMAMLFMAVSPRLLGEAYNNAKDPTFAAAYVMGAYYLICFIQEMPNPSWKTTLWTMVSFGLAFAVRVGGLILFVYLFIFVMASILLNRETREKLIKVDINYYGGLLIKSLTVLAGMWLIGILTWPSALMDPLGQPLHALDVQSKYPTVIRVLFGGEYIPSNEVPWNYNFSYILLTSPVVVIIGFIVGLVFIPSMRKRFNMMSVSIVLFISIFPLLYIIYKDSALYNGWRHSYFTYCGVVVFAALGFESLILWTKTNTVKYIIYAVVAIGVAMPLTFIIKNFPVIYVYFNEFAGGVDGTYGDYQLDYYACSAMPIANWMEKNVPYDSTKVLLTNNPLELNECFKMHKSRWRSSYVRFRERYERNWDYAVFLPQFVDPHLMKKGEGYFPPQGTIYSFKVDNSVIACVVKRQDKLDMQGIDSLKKNKIPAAITLLEQAVKNNDKNEVAWAYLGVAYASAGNRDEALKALNTALSISPEYQLAEQYRQQIMQGK